MDSDGIGVVRRFFAAMADRDLAAAQQLTAPGFRLVASGNQGFTDLHEFAAHSSQRQKSVAKHLEHFESVATPRGEVVYCRGTMSGTWLNDTPYEDIRFVDRFLVRDGRIEEMQVWSDMAEFRPRQGR